VIPDADLSVAPEDLTQFHEALLSGKGEFINGCRLVYSMDARAMRFLNLLGNRFFALLRLALAENVHAGGSEAILPCMRSGTACDMESWITLFSYLL
jgi:hypothetical protein